MGPLIKRSLISPIICPGCLVLKGFAESYTFNFLISILSFSLFLSLFLFSNSWWTYWAITPNSDVSNAIPTYDYSVIISIADQLEVEPYGNEPNSGAVSLVPQIRPGECPNSFLSKIDTWLRTTILSIDHIKKNVPIPILFFFLLFFFKIFLYRLFLPLSEHFETIFGSVHCLFIPPLLSSSSSSYGQQQQQQQQ